MSTLRGIMKRRSSIIVLGLGIGIKFYKDSKNLHLALLRGEMNSTTAVFVLGADVCIESCRQCSYDINAFVFYSQEKWCPSVISHHISVDVEFVKKGLKNLHLAILQGKMNGVTTIIVLGVDVCIESCRQRSYDINAFVFYSQEKWCPAVISHHIS